MDGRFTDIPQRLRDVSTRLPKQLSDGEWLAIAGLMEDAALQIEALRRASHGDSCPCPDCFKADEN